MKHPFSTYNVGDHITDPDQVARWQTSHPDFVVRKDLPEPVFEIEPSIEPVEIPAYHLNQE